MENKKEFRVMSFSGGKDSTAMVLKAIEKGIIPDEIIFCDTSVEFPEIYENIKLVERAIKMPITILKADHDFEYYMLEYTKTRGKNKGTKGYSFPDFRNRWCTQMLKKSVIKKYMKKYKDYKVIEYHGIAYDEQQRIGKNKDDGRNIEYPLNDWKMTEADCLQYCYDRGFTWGGLYEKFARLSCWCCPLSRIGELRVLWKEYPELWAKLENWQSKTYRKFRSDYSVFELTEKFKKEELNNK